MTTFRVGAPAYWFPAHFVPSAWVQHAPFAYWLVSALQPRSIVELGTHNGFSFFVLAEAVKRLDIECSVHAVDSWEGDDHAGFYGQEVFESVAAVAESDYSGVAHLHRAYFSDAVSEFADASIDLLHIDGRHGYDDVKSDFETYLPKLSRRAVVIFHDTHEFQNGFGVHRYWDELAATRPSFNFHHGHGLGVLAVGDDVPESITAFLEAANSDPMAVRDAFHTLGRAVEDSSEERMAHLERLAHSERAERANRELLQEKYAAALSELEHLRGSASWRLTAPLRKLRAILPR